WAWALFLGTGVFGFGSFLAYLGYGYLDSWHGVATLVLLPCYVIGLARSYCLLPRPVPWRRAFRSARPLGWCTRAHLGRLLLLGSSAGLVVGGLIILTVGI